MGRTDGREARMEAPKNEIHLGGSRLGCDSAGGERELDGNPALFRGSAHIPPSGDFPNWS